MTDWFLERAKAKLATAQLLGVLDRWIRRRLREASDEELWMVNRSIWKRCRELAILDSPSKLPSMGALYRTYKGYPLVKYVSQEEGRRFDEKMKDYKSPFDDLSDGDLDSYIVWRRDKNPDDVDKLSVEELLTLWRREGRRVLPVVPRSGSLPSNAHVRRPPNNREGSGRPRRTAEAGQAEEKKAPLREGEEESRVSIQDREIH